MNIEKKIIKYFNRLVIFLLAGGITIYSIVLLSYLVIILIGYPISEESFYKQLKDHPIGMVGLPVSALASYAITNLLYADLDEKAISFKFFGLEFSGPAVPLTLFSFCYLIFIASIYAIFQIKI